MKTYIALLRGINVGGNKNILMADLRNLLTKIGLQHVQTYIQSGNVIFQSQENNIKNLVLLIHQSIKNQFGFDVPVLIKTPEALQAIFNNCPFSQEQKIQSYFTFLYAVPDKETTNEVSQICYVNETFTITNTCVYFYCSTGYGKAKCSNNFFERKLNVTATARNYKTMVKLLSLSTDLK